jgi:Domain of unknown function (DUF4331)
MKRLAIVAAMVAIGVAVPLSLGSSHREAPLTSIDPTGDDTDVYAYTANDAPHSLTVAANWVPFEDPAGGPNFYKFDPKARYYINIDNDGDGKYDVRYRFRFRDHVRNPNSFLYALPGVSSIDDPKLNVFQTYDVDRLVYGQNGKRGADDSRKGRKHRKAKHRHRHGKRHHYRDAARSTEIIEDAFVAPNNVGQKTIPDYEKVAEQAITSIPGGGKVFAGQREDPFFVDLGQTFDAINFRPGVVPGDHGGGKDDLAGYGVHSIVMQVPEADVTKDGEQVDSQSDKNAVVGVWASTERRRVQVVGQNDSDNGNGNDWVQVSRLGNPLVNEVVIPLGQKDRFNATSPADDAKNFGKFVVNPELAKIMNILFPGVVNAPETGRTDIVRAVLQGLPGLNEQSGKPVDTLKVNLGTPPAANPSRLGALAGDLQGYPNGRRLTDDVTDIALRVVAGALADPSKFPELKDACKTATCPNPIPLGDGVDQNDKSFLGHFPYLNQTDSGLDSKIKGFPPTAP